MNDGELVPSYLVDVLLASAAEYGSDDFTWKELEPGFYAVDDPDSGSLLVDVVRRQVEPTMPHALPKDFPGLIAPTRNYRVSWDDNIIGEVEGHMPASSAVRARQHAGAPPDAECVELTPEEARALGNKWPS